MLWILNGSAGADSGKGDDVSFYDPLHRDFWSVGSKARGRSAIAKLVYIYAFSNPRCSAAGIYPFDIDECVRSIGPKIEVLGRDVDDGDIQNSLLELQKTPPLIRFDAATSVIWVIGKWKRSMIKSANHKRRIGTEFLMSSAYPFWREFFDRNPDVFNFLNRAKSYKKQGEFKCCWEALDRSVAGNLSGMEGKGRKSQDFPSLPRPDTTGDRRAPKGAAAPGKNADPSPAEAKRIVAGVMNSVVDPELTRITKESIDNNTESTEKPQKINNFATPVDHADTESERRKVLMKQLQSVTEGEHDESDQTDP